MSPTAVVTEEIVDFCLTRGGALRYNNIHKIEISVANNIWMGHHPAGENQ